MIIAQNLSRRTVTIFQGMYRDDRLRRVLRSELHGTFFRQQIFSFFTIRVQSASNPCPTRVHPRPIRVHPRPIRVQSASHPRPSASNPGPIRVQSASNPRPIHVQFVSNPRPIRVQSASWADPKFLEEILRGMVKNH